MGYRQRWIHPEFWDSAQVGALSIPAALLWASMFSHADDEGRLSGSVAYLHAVTFKYRRRATQGQVEGWRREILEAPGKRPLAILYLVEGQEYLWLPGFRERDSQGREVGWQKPEYPKTSKLPAPPPVNFNSQPDNSVKDHRRISDASPTDHRSIGDASPVGRVGLGCIGLGRVGLGCIGLGRVGLGREGTGEGRADEPERTTGGAPGPAPAEPNVASDLPPVEHTAGEGGERRARPPGSETIVDRLRGVLQEGKQPGRRRRSEPRQVTVQAAPVEPAREARIAELRRQGEEIAGAAENLPEGDEDIPEVVAP